MEAKQLTINGRSLKIFDSQNGEKGTILGLHGLSGNGYSLQYFAEEFSKEYRFITIDLYGRGDSKSSEDQSDLFQHAEDILGVIEALDLDEVIVLGYSMGGFIASIAAGQTETIKAVVLLDGFASMSEHQRPIIEPSLGRLSQVYPSKEHYITETASAYEKLGITNRPELRRLLAYEIEEKEGSWENKAAEALVRQDWESFWDVDIQRIGQQITQPVLLVIALGDIGEQPPLFLPEHYERTKTAIEQLEIVYTDANHYRMGFEPREDINRSIKAFLEKVDGEL